MKHMATPDFPFTDPIIVEVIGVTLALAWFMMVAGIWVSFCWKTTMKNHGKTWGKNRRNETRAMIEMSIMMGL